MNTAKITSKGQITIPKAIREHLHLHAGDQVDFVMLENGKVFLCPCTLGVEEIFGMFDETGKNVSVEDMNEAIKQHFSKPKK